MSVPLLILLFLVMHLNGTMYYQTANGAMVMVLQQDHSLRRIKGVGAPNLHKNIIAVIAYRACVG